MKTILGDRAHIERRRGTAEEARAYCMKEDGRLEDPKEQGDFSGSTPSTNGRRTDLITVKQRIGEGATEKQIAEDFFGLWCQYHGAFRRYRQLCSGNRDFKTRVTVIVGPPGTGKSKWALDEFPLAYWKQRSQWWDGYEGHDAVVIDDFYGWLPYDQLLRICDRYPLMTETKGGQCNFVAKDIVITSNHTPAQWYKNIGNVDAFVRRVTSWRYFGQDGVKMETVDYSRFCNAVDRNFHMVEA